MIVYVRWQALDGVAVRVTLAFVVTAGYFRFRSLPFLLCSLSILSCFHVSKTVVSAVAFGV